MMPIGPRKVGATILHVEPFDIAGLSDVEKERVRLIRGLRTDPSCRRKGDARWLLCEVCVEADNHRTVLILEPKPDEDGPMSADDLMLFYRRFGFVVTQREPQTFMARAPRAPAGRQEINRASADAWMDRYGRKVR